MTIVLIGGAPTAGKSYTARKIAEECKIPWISTDTIREQMRKIVRKKDYPSLFNHQFEQKDISKQAVAFLTKNSSDKIVKIQNQESKDVWKGVKAIIETDYVWKSFLIEGVAILPQEVHALMKRDKRVRALFLFEKNTERIREIVYTRGLWDDARAYPDSVKEKEVEWVIKFNNYIKKETKKYNLPCIEMGNRTEYLHTIKKMVES